MIGKAAGAVALFERFLGRPLLNITALFTKSLCVEKFCICSMLWYQL